MIVTIVRVRLVRAGFDVTFHPLSAPWDVRSVVAEPNAMPSGHELLRTGETVNLQIDNNNKITFVSRCGRSRSRRR